MLHLHSWSQAARQLDCMIGHRPFHLPLLLSLLLLLLLLLPATEAKLSV